MKNILIGCLVIVGIIALVAAGLLFYGYKTFLSPAMQATVKLAESYDKTNDEFTFIIPKSGLLKEARFLEFLKIRKSVNKKAAEMFKEVEHLARKKGENLSVTEAMALPKKLFGAISETGNYHITLLREHSMPYSEYTWHFRTLFSTIYRAANQDDETAEMLLEHFESGDSMDTLLPDVGKEVDIENALLLGAVDFHEENLEMIVRHRDFIQGSGTYTYESFLFAFGEHSYEVDDDNAE